VGLTNEQLFSRSARVADSTLTKARDRSQPWIYRLEPPIKIQKQNSFAYGVLGCRTKLRNGVTPSGTITPSKTGYPVTQAG